MNLMVDKNLLSSSSSSDDGLEENKFMLESFQNSDVSNSSDEKNMIKS
jgi:hypothetical protein